MSADLAESAGAWLKLIYRLRCCRRVILRWGRKFEDPR